MNDGSFQLHPRFTADTVPVARWTLSLVLMMRERRWPWLVLVPQRPVLREIHELDPADRALLIEEVARASAALAHAVAADKINVGAIGNLVPQLHIHIVARHVDDPAWPQPVWGALPFNPMDGEETAARLECIRRAIA